MVTIKQLENKLKALGHPAKAGKETLILLLHSYLSSLDDESFQKLVPNNLTLEGDTRSDQVTNLIESVQFYPLIPKKITIPKGHLKSQCWYTYIGEYAVCICPMCNYNEMKLSTVDWHLSHIIPDSDGGPYEISNFRPLCAMCNYSMGCTNMKDFCKQNYPQSYERLKLDVPYKEGQMLLDIRLPERIKIKEPVVPIVPEPQIIKIPIVKIPSIIPKISSMSSPITNEVLTSYDSEMSTNNVPFVSDLNKFIINLPRK